MHHAPLTVPLALTEAVFLTVTRVLLTMLPPVAFVSFAPGFLGRSLVLPVVWVVFELLLLPLSLSGFLTVDASAAVLVENSGMGENSSRSGGTSSPWLLRNHIGWKECGPKMPGKIVLREDSEAVYGDGGVGLKTGGVAAGRTPVRRVSSLARGGSDAGRRF